MKYIIASGWWCSDTEDNRAKLHGDDQIRAKDFHKVWYRCIDRFTNPEKIIIVDSNSPIKPELNKIDSRIEFISLNTNAGHSTNHSGQFCGYIRAIMLSLEYALECDIQYYVYVEQDALIYGSDIIEKCIKSMRSPYMFGHGDCTPQKIQQSFFIIKKTNILTFMDRYRSIPFRDNQISPEEKFCISANALPVKALSYLFIASKKYKSIKSLYNLISQVFTIYQTLPIGYGRKRPINFNDNTYYFQHGSKEEIEKFLHCLQVN